LQSNPAVRRFCERMHERFRIDTIQRRFFRPEKARLLLRGFLLPAALAAAVMCLLDGCSPAQPLLETPETAAVLDSSDVGKDKPPAYRIEELPPDSLLLEGDASEHPALSSFWVDSVMSDLPLRRRIAQMITPFSYSSAAGKKLRELREQVTALGVGGVIISLGSVSDAVRLIDSLQAWSEVPLLISADFENGAAMRLRGAIEYPSLMALGAARSPELAYGMGLEVAREARDIGVTQIYSPVADVNNNPLNPVINTRSFGGDPGLVASLAEAYMRGLQDGRVMETAKHFPGHGATDRDSHSDLPVLPHSRARLDSVELLPFRRLIGAGVLSVMSGHLAVPALDSGVIRPATLSPVILDSLLRGELDFRGLIVTDALNMKGVRKQYGGGRAAVEAVKAGADVLLMPESPAEAVESIASAVDSGEIAVERIDRSVRRILLAKEWLGLTERRTPRRPAPDSLFADSSRLNLSRSIARRSITLIRNEDGLVPLAPDSTRGIACLSLLQGSDAAADARLREELSTRAHGMRFFTVTPDLSRRRSKALADSLRRFRTLVIASFLSPRNGAGKIALTKDQRSLLEKIRRRKPAVALLTFGSPYIAADFPWAQACVCAWGADPHSVAAASEVLFGEIRAEGIPPVSIPGVAELIRHGADSEFPVPEVPLAKTFRRVDSLVMNAVRRGAFPGGQLVVLKAGRVAHSACYGRLAYGEDSPPVTDGTLYDLASLTKVTATTTAAMKLYEEGSLKLDTAVAAYLPAFARGGKSRVTVRNLLLHNSGLPAFRAYERFCSTAEKAVDTILAEPLAYATGTRTVYSDLGIIALGKLIESVTGMSLDRYADSAIFRPLGMRRTMFRPNDSLRGECAPTELDTVWRKRLVQGEVHDERAALLGGIAGHAGLFSTAADLSRFVLMLMNEGSHEGRACLKPATIAEFTRRQGSGSRALGWDTKSTGASSAGRYFGARSYGHTGFTGTSIWIDPDSRIAVIFLTNRVHPTRDNKALLSFRAVLHDAVREALAGIGLPGD